MGTKEIEAEGAIAFDEIYDPEVLSKVYKSYDEYLNIGDFSKKITEYIFKDVTANEKLNVEKILTNLDFEDAIPMQPEFLLMNCIASHTIDLHLNNPEKVTYHHKLALYSLDLFYDMEGDPEYPHANFVDQLEESFEMMGGEKAAIQFIETAYSWVLPSHIQAHKDYLKEAEERNNRRYKR